MSLAKWAPYMRRRYVGMLGMGNGALVGVLYNCRGIRGNEGLKGTVKAGVIPGAGLVNLCTRLDTQQQR